MARCICLCRRVRRSELLRLNTKEDEKDEKGLRAEANAIDGVNKRRYVAESG